jgi:DNA-binding transcriptional MerR regulator/methylmalonyl-CoA mutase cobalamin-binding subunit
MKYYNIQTVSELCGVSTHCIRAWEKRYQAVTPERSENGRRVYSEEELERLMMLGKLSTLGNSISLISKLPNEELKALLEKMSAPAPKASVARKTSLLDPKIYLMNMMMALQSYKLDVLTHELNKASMDLSCRDFALEVVAALFRKVGEYVQSGRMSIAQEHTLSAITKFFVGKRIGQHYLSDQRSPVKILMATPVGEHHTIGLMLSALLCAEHGIDFVYLGENLPEESIIDAAKATNAKIVLLGTSPFYANRSHGINEVLAKLREGLPEAKLWVGGAVKEIRPSLGRTINLETFGQLDELDKKLQQIADQVH